MNKLIGRLARMFYTPAKEHEDDVHEDQELEATAESLTGPDYNIPQTWLEPSVPSLPSHPTPALIESGIVLDDLGGIPLSKLEEKLNVGDVIISNKDGTTTIVPYHPHLFEHQKGLIKLAEKYSEGGEFARIADSLIENKPGVARLEAAIAASGKKPRIEWARQFDTEPTYKWRRTRVNGNTVYYRVTL